MPVNGDGHPSICTVGYADVGFGVDMAGQLRQGLMQVNKIVVVAMGDFGFVNMATVAVFARFAVVCVDRHFGGVGMGVIGAGNSGEQ